MVHYTPKRKYSKKPSTQFKKVIKKIKKETVEAIQATPTKPVVKSFWQKAIDWIKGIAG